MLQGHRMERQSVVKCLFGFNGIEHVLASLLAGVIGSALKSKLQKHLI